MIPTRIRLQGFLSYGSNAQTLEFGDSPMWLLAGPNGAGKSSVFDAIQFALYGSHRDGKTGFDNLIHKGQDRFEIEVEFIANDRTFCVRRSRDNRDNQTCEVFEVTGEGPNRSLKALPEVGRATLTQWVQSTLGMTEETFAASTLLKQGGSDALIEADKNERFKMLSELVNLSDYDRLYSKADALHKHWKGRQESAKRRMDAIFANGDSGLKDARQESAAQERQAQKQQRILDASKRLLSRLGARKVHAQNLVKLVREEQELQTAIKEAAPTLQQEAQIQADSARWNGLRTALPILRELRSGLEARARCEADLAANAPNQDSWQTGLASHYHLPEETDGLLTILLTAVEAEESALTATQTALPWLRMFAEARAEGQLAKQVHDLQNARSRQISRIRTLVEAKLQGADQAKTDAERLAQEQRDAWRNAQMQVKTAQERAHQMDALDGSPACDICGQELSPLHLATERERRTSAQQMAEAALLEAECAYRAAQEAQQQAQTRCRLWQGRQQMLDTKSGQLEADKRATNSDYKHARANAQNALNALAGLSDNYAAAIGIAAQAVLDNSLEWLDSTYPTDKDCAHLLRQCARLPQTRTILEAVRGLSQSDSKINQNLCLLTDEWRQEVMELDANRLKTRIIGWDRETAELAGADTRLALLTTAKDKQVARQLRLERIGVDRQEILYQAECDADALDLESIECRMRYADARQIQAQTTRENALKRQQTLEENSLAYCREREDWKSAELKAARHKKLAELIGPVGLQRELLWEAERGILAHANETLETLSDGQLRLQLRSEMNEQTASDGVKFKKIAKSRLKEAFDVVCCNSEIGGHGIGLAFLSGSQKFRVAVSLALGIGQYFGREGQGAQAVIIDEGFGSLDKQNRDVMIAELQKLSGKLKRIIVVSHQEEFRDAFEYRYDIRLDKHNHASITQMVTPLHPAVDESDTNAMAENERKI